MKATKQTELDWWVGCRGRRWGKEQVTLEHSMYPEGG